jgi:type I restriction enzyme R subunit
VTPEIDIEQKVLVRWNLKENRKDPAVTNAVIRTIAAFLNAEGGDVLIGVSMIARFLGSKWMLSKTRTSLCCT